jgi:hypothetical protein
VAAESELSRVTEWLKVRLSDGTVYTKVLKADAAGYDISEITLRRALTLLGCRKGKEKKGEGRWFWSLPIPLPESVITSRFDLSADLLECKSLADL